ncbi:hypothetical protein J1614_003723 [Plenodomus biglobosus]|nr:hypothetical protein J1614_003723 [Plenodomus biglobosus]
MMKQHDLAANIDARNTTSSPANERVVCIIDQSGFCKRLEKKSYNQHQADPPPGPRDNFIHGPSPLAQSCISCADIDLSSGLSAPSAAQNIRHECFYLEDLENEYTRMPSLETEIHTPKNHYDKAPCVFGDRNHRERGWNAFLQKQESQRATDFEREFRLREAECKKASSAAISSSRLKAIFYSVDPVGKNGILNILGGKS